MTYKEVNIVNIEELLQQYPLKRIKPVDGMAVTADVWEETHEYHRRSQGFHSLFSHGPGILSGLDVIASDPPDTSLYILPGLAMDSAGQTIVLPQPVAYDIGHDLEGLLYLILSYGESRPRAEGGSQQEGAPLYVHGEFSISARSTLPDTPGVELARVRRSSRNSVLLNAQNPARPDLDEIDLRSRQEVGAAREVTIAVNYLGEVAEKKHGLGLAYLAQTLNYLGRYRVMIEDDAPIGPSIVTNTIIYLVGQGSFELSSGAMNGLRNYVHRGKGTLLIESMDSEAESSFMNFLKAKEMQPEPLLSGHRLLTQPYVFAAPPTGFETQGNPQLLVSDGVIFSGYNYGLVWQGERRGRHASREEIRAATEWGINIISYALHRRRG
jgi:hypothetical protein